MNLNEQLSEFLQSKPKKEVFHDESQLLIKWFLENKEFFPQEKFDIWRTKHGSEIWYEPQKVYDFIIKAIKEKGSDFEHAITQIRKLKKRMGKEIVYEKENEKE